MTLTFYPAIDRDLSKYITTRDSFGKTLSHWRETDYYRHLFLTIPSSSNDYLSSAPVVRSRLRAGPTLRLLLRDDPAAPPMDESTFVDWAASNAVEGDYVQRPMRDLVSVTDTYRHAGSYAGATQGGAKLLLPILSGSLAEMETWFDSYEEVLGPSEIGGFVLAPGAEPTALLSAMIFHSEKLADYPVHYEGLSGTRAIASISYVLSDVKGPVSFDSAAALSARFMLTYFLPFTVRNSVRLIKGDEIGPSLPCDCAPCQPRRASDFAGSREYEKVVPMVLHNIVQIQRFARICAAFQIYRGTEGYYTQWVPKDVRKIIEGYEFARSKGFETLRNYPTVLDGSVEPGQQRVFEIPIGEAPALCPICGEREGTEARTLNDRPVRLCGECANFAEEYERAIGTGRLGKEKSV